MTAKREPENLMRGKSEKDILRLSIRYASLLALLMWVGMALQWAYDMRLSKYGIKPRTLEGLLGMITGPLIHGDVFHLISNTIPLLILCITLFYFYYRIAGEIFLWIYLVTGFWVWLLARDAYHIGASGLVYGMASFLFFSGIFRRNSRLLVVTLIVLFLYGGMVYGVFPNPSEPQISWESHALSCQHPGHGIPVIFGARKDLEKHRRPCHHTGKAQSASPPKDDYCV